MLPPEPDLHVIQALPAGPPRATLLFVHGAYFDNWCWEPYYLPYFAARGIAAYALSLRGHGRSGGASALFAASLDDYASDVRAVAARLPSPPILVGHSMGAAIVERILESDPIPGAVLLAPIPPVGLLQAFHRLIAERPGLALDYFQLESGRPSRAALEALCPLYFTENTRPHLLWEALARLQPESQRVLLDLAVRWPAPVWHPRPPILVLAPARDPLFPPAQVEVTAAHHGTEALTVPGLPHMLMLDDGWQAGADAIARWLDRTPGVARAPLRPLAAEAWAEG